MSDQAERPTDLWATVELVHICYGDNAFFYEVDAVDEARAADAAQIASLTAQVKQQDEAFDIEREDATKWRIECGKAEAERDTAQQENKTLREALTSTARFLYHSPDCHSTPFGMPMRYSPESHSNGLCDCGLCAALAPRPQDR